MYSPTWGKNKIPYFLLIKYNVIWLLFIEFS